MVKKGYASLIRIENDRPVKKETDKRFLHAVKLGLLLALREQSILTDQQLDLAMKELGGLP